MSILGTLFDSAVWLRAVASVAAGGCSLVLVKLQTLKLFSIQGGAGEGEIMCIKL